MFEPTAIPPKHPPLGTLIYDGTCAVCTTTIARRYRFFEHYGFAVMPLQSPEAAVRAQRDIATLMTAIHLVMADGRVFVGVDSFRVLFAHIGWLKPVAWLLRVPVVYTVAVRLYAEVAKRRHRNVCRLG
jgi:predicted DCC family thiol-disulfide oxidoreductase YuxK